MSIQFRNYTKEPGITEDYFKVREFFVDLGFAEFTYARWDWMITHSYLDKSAVGKIGIWEDSGRIIGVATFDTSLGETFCLTFSEYAHLKKEMLLYAMKNLSETDRFSILISDVDIYFQAIAADLGFIATPKSDEDAIFYIEKSSTHYDLPAAFPNPIFL